MPLGVDVVEPPMLFALQAAGIDGPGRPADDAATRARSSRSDEIVLLNMAAALVDGVYQMISEALKPGMRENEIVALATKLLYELGSDDVEGINAISGERCCPHPHVFSDRLIRPGDQAYFDIIQAYMGYRTCYYRTFAVGRATRTSATPTGAPGSGWTRAIDAVEARRHDRPDRQRSGPDRRRVRLRQRDGVLRAPVRPRRSGLALHERPLSSAASTR